ncbi:DEAD/DEAH box helicase family protein [uncultured Marinobacter sp.]|uniref:DEAD/DEAH box helicase family protein n=1 Tax=uncultured Marinobacter sp. TaxID=187379 RepID=UPI0025DDB030|nr:DEAD/DEAH box helicase family protein [uncultured Marinobacter sp.]
MREILIDSGKNVKITSFKDVDSLHHSEFEEFVKDLFLGAGWTDAYITKVGDEYKSGDGGVDIFAYRNGKKFAIEVKQRNINSAVDVKALNQLVTGARLGKASNLILVTNSYFTSEVLTRALRLGVELIDRDELQNLWLAGHSEIGREIKPRKYQADIIDESLKKYESGSNKLLIEMATGLGKTYTVALLIKRLMAKSVGRTKKVLFIAHQIEILLQTVTAFKNVFGIGNYSFSACFAGVSAENTDFVFASFDTLYSKLSELQMNQFDFIIVDEAHHTPASTYRQVVEAFSPQLLVGLTATPFRSDNQDVNAFFGGESGHVGKYDLVWALANKKLAFPRYHVLLDDLDQTKINQLKSGLSISDLDKKLFLHKKDKEVVGIIEKTVEEKALAPVKGIVFCRSISHIKHLIKFFKLGSAVYVHSKQSQDERRENIRKFREGNVSYILVCNLFNEGVDIPETNLLVFMRYTGSQTIWLQQLGRGLRKTHNKEYVDVLDFVGSLERLQEVTGFARAVSNTQPDPSEANDEGSKESSPVHDSSIEVVYSESAAQVLDLIQSLQYRLNTRSELIRKLEDFYKSEKLLPTINQIEMYLPELSGDQIATHFGSYFGYLSAVFDNKTFIKEVSGKISHFIDDYISTNLIRPSLRAVCSGMSFGFLPYVTERELEVLGFSKHEEDIDGKIQEISKDRIKSNPDNEHLKFRSDNEYLSPKPGSFNEGSSDIIGKYINQVYGMKDFESLSLEEQAIIKDRFRSPFVFISKLNKARKAIK